MVCSENKNSELTGVLELVERLPLSSEVNLFSEGRAVLPGGQPSREGGNFAMVAKAESA